MGRHHDDYIAPEEQPQPGNEEPQPATEELQPSTEPLTPVEAAEAAAAAAHDQASGLEPAFPSFAALAVQHEGETADGVVNPPSQSKRRRKAPLYARILGVIGEILITIGVFLGLFVVWQVWWTDIGANKEQAQLIEKTREEYNIVTPKDAEGNVKIGQPRTDPPPKMNHHVKDKEVLGIVRIPRFGLDYEHTLEEGIGLENVLDSGSFGRYPDTGWPGEVGNFAISAHRQSYGAALRNAPDLEVGDAVIIETKQAYYVYKVISHEIVWPDEVRVISRDPLGDGKKDDRLMTMTTCHPPFVSNQRWVTYLRYDHWVDPADGVPVELTKEAK